MADNFNMKKFLAENKLGAYSKLKNKVEETKKEVSKENSYAKGGKFEVDSTYTHFAVGKKDGKIITGWEYKDLDKEDIKRFTDMDLKDMDFNPRDFRILTTRFLKSQGIDPFDWSNWKKTSESEGDEMAKGGGVKGKVNRNKWRLPTKEEFENVLYPNKDKIPNLKKDSYYWSSSEDDYGGAWHLYFGTGTAFYYGNKGSTKQVRAVRDVSSDSTNSSNSTIIGNLEIYNEDLGSMNWGEATRAVERLNDSSINKDINTESFGGKNPEGDKLVLRFLQGVAKKFDYPVSQAAIFVKDTIKSLGY
jgi:hypothetical protein